MLEFMKSLPLISRVCFFQRDAKFQKNRWHSFSVFFSSETYYCSQMLLKRGVNV